MNNLLSYCGLVDAKIRASDKDLPVLITCCTLKNAAMNSKLGAIENLEFPQFSFYRSDDLCILQSVFRIHLAAFADYMRIKCNTIFVMCHFLGIKIHLWKSCKVEKILNGSLDLIPSPSPSVKIQIMGGKVCLRCKG